MSFSKAVFYAVHSPWGGPLHRHRNRTIEGNSSSMLKCRPPTEQAHDSAVVQGLVRALVCPLSIPKNEESGFPRNREPGYEPRCDVSWIHPSAPESRTGSLLNAVCGIRQLGLGDIFRYFITLTGWNIVSTTLCDRSIFNEHFLGGFVPGYFQLLLPQGVLSSRVVPRLQLAESELTVDGTNA